MEARISHPAFIVPGAMEALQALDAAARQGGVPERTLELVHLRVSQINGCIICSDGACQIARRAGESDERLDAVAGWREADTFTGPERAALALAEAVTRMSDRDDPVPDDLWNEAARHYEEPALASLVLSIASNNVWNRLNVATRQPLDSWAP